MSEIIDKLTRLQREIENARRERDQLEGRLAAAEDRLLDEFGVKPGKDANRLLKKLNDDIGRGEIEIQNRIKDLEKRYEW